MSKIGQVEIKPKCRDVHGTLGAFDEAVKLLKQNYGMFANSEKLQDATYIIELKIKQQ